MTANAPYYQMRSGQFMNTRNNTNAAPPQFVPEHDEYDLSTPTGVASPLGHRLHPHIYTEHAARQTSADHTMEENHNLVELLEAATAAGQVAEAMNIGHAAPATPALQGRSKRKRASTSPAQETSYQADETAKAKRRRTGGPTDPRFHESDRDMRGTSADGSVPPSSESLLNDARAAGVHSAAALFRRSSERTSRKYTRPPMSKLFMSLQLSPENFLQLQASAKAYMLDASHPERQNCVGNRGKGDTDMVKLRLFNCVRDFLNDRVGEQFFGENVEKPGEKDAIEAARALGEEKMPGAGERLTWPRDGNKIISLVTPLMRRMVTNERQRQYAIETRKGGAKKKDKEGSVEATPEQVHDNTGYEQHLQTAFDTGLGHSPLSAQPTSPPRSTHVVPAQYSLRKHKGYADLRGTIAETEAQASVPPTLRIPTAGPTEPSLSHINVFLVLASSGTRSGTKIDEKRITAEPQAHLAWYDYNDFIKNIFILLIKAKATYPEIRARAVPQQNDAGTDSLRGLAAAANALQSEHTQHRPGQPSPIMSTAHQSFPEEVSGIPPTPVSAVNETHNFNINYGHDAELLPRYVVKSIGPEGWREIRNADDWYSVLREKALAVWADGVCNVLVELVDVPGVAA